MIKHFISITLRNLLRNKTYTLINMIGLAIGMGLTLIIALASIYKAITSKGRKAAEQKNAKEEDNSPDAPETDNAGK